LRRETLLETAYPAAVLVLTVIHVLAPQRSGPIALTEVFAPHLFLVALLFLPLAIRPSASSALRLTVVGVLVVAVVRFGTEWYSPAHEDGPGTPVEVLVWNLELGSDAGRDVVRVMSESRADVIVLQELTPDHVAAIEAADGLAERYPHRLLQPSDDVLGIGLLSTFPIVASEPLLEPAGFLAELDIGAAEPLVVMSAHPLPPQYALAMSLIPIPIGYQPLRRDDALGLLRERVDEVLAADPQLILVGDFNVTPDEPAYAELADGLLDAHLEVGVGPGWTWRPRQIEAIPAGLLRIDYLFVGGGIVPVASGTDCSHPSDHCVVHGRVLAGDGVRRPPAAVDG
jgi:endonuclease/exonuclease/phosphatase family metal-dependent hydrolase